MSDKCPCCASLTLRKLYDYAQTHHDGDFSEQHHRTDAPPLRFTYDFPQEAYVRHHRSWQDLEDSAGRGCQLCCVIRDEFVEFSEEVRQAVKEKVDQGLRTDIRICLDAYRGRPTDGSAPLFDLLIIQVGDPRPSEPDEPEIVEPDDTSSRVVFQLNRQRGASEDLCDLQIGRLELDPDLGSESNLRLARSWLQECSEEHVALPRCVSNPLQRVPRKCRNLIETRLPTRVIDVGSHAEETPRLFITDGVYSHYATLSHCWGGSSSLTLTRESLESFTNEMPMDLAPANFKHAVTITRKLGLQYLWIDSLCIMQDSHIDWEVEAPRMSDVYKNAVVTIAASASPNTNAGILSCCDNSLRSLKYSCRLPLDMSDPGQVSLSRRLTMDEEEEFADCFLTSRLPLASRGWVLQEQALSPRTLFFGKRAIYWNCRSSQRSADNDPGNPFLKEKIPDAIPPIFLDFACIDRVLNAEEKQDVYYHWLGIVSTYAERQLTKESDRLPALSGLATEVNRLTGASYRAGIWLEDLFNGLLWYPTCVQEKKITYSRGPSWSWVNIDTDIAFISRDARPVSGPFKAEIVAVEVKPLGQDPYGAIASGFVELNACTFQICRSKEQHIWTRTLSNYMWKGSWPNSSFNFLDGLDMFCGSEMTPFPQIERVRSHDDVEEGEWFLTLLLGTWEESRTGDGAIFFNVYALLLRPCTSNNEVVYERVGVFKFETFESPYIVGRSFERQTVKII